VGIIQSWRSKN